MTEVGSKKTPHYPDHCSKTQGGREGSESASTPQMREQGSSYEKKKGNIARTLRREG